MGFHYIFSGYLKSLSFSQFYFWYIHVSNIEGNHNSIVNDNDNDNDRIPEIAIEYLLYISKRNLVS